MHHFEMRRAVHRLRLRARCGRCKMLLDERWDRTLPPLPPPPAQTPPSTTSEENSVEKTLAPPAAPGKVNRRRLTRAMRRKLLADRTARKLTYDSESSVHSAANAVECSDENLPAETAGTAVIGGGGGESSAAPQMQQLSHIPADTKCPIQNEQAVNNVLVVEARKDSAPGDHPPYPKVRPPHPSPQAGPRRQPPLTQPWQRLCQMLRRG